MDQLTEDTVAIEPSPLIAVHSADLNQALANPTFEVRYAERNSDEYFATLHDVFNVRRPFNRRNSPPIRGLMSDARKRGLVIDPVLCVFDGETKLASCATVQSPGSSAIVFLSLRAPGQASPTEAGIALVTAAREIARRRGIRLLQMLINPEDAVTASVAQSSGFRLMTQLYYLRRDVGAFSPTFIEANDITWEAYSEHSRTTFLRAIELSYVESLDCPELFGLRNTADILETHRSSGHFFPECWWVAKLNNEPVGVVLLNGVREPFGLELVYMGVAQVARRSGVANALLARAVQCCVEKSASYLTLAVDARNTPAKKLYARWELRPMHRMDAWIATYPCT